MTRRLVIVEEHVLTEGDGSHVGYRLSGTIKTEFPDVRCDRCKHWAAPSEWGWPDDTGWRFGEYYLGTKCCKEIGKSVGNAIEAHYAGGGGHDQFTRPDFGCSLFEPSVSANTSATTTKESGGQR